MLFLRIVLSSSPGHLSENKEYTRRSSFPRFSPLLHDHGKRWHENKGSLSREKPTIEIYLFLPSIRGNALRQEKFIGSVLSRFGLLYYCALVVHQYGPPGYSFSSYRFSLFVS